MKARVAGFGKQNYGRGADVLGIFPARAPSWCLDPGADMIAKRRRYHIYVLNV
jgi:hypothetical protein